MNITLLEEFNGNQCILHVKELPGACAFGATQKDAMAKIPTEVRLYCAWCGLPTNEAVWMKIEEKKENANDLNNFAALSLFDFDGGAITEEAFASLKAVAKRMADDVQAMKDCAGNKALNAAYDKAEKEIYGLFDYNGKNGREGFFAAVAKKDGYLENKSFKANGADWTLMKAIRLLLTNDRQLAENLYFANLEKKGDALPDPFFLADDKLSFNMTTFV